MKALTKISIAVGIIVISLYSSNHFKDTRKEMRQSYINKSSIGVITDDMVEYTPFEPSVQDFIRECERQGLTGDIYICNESVEDSEEISRCFILETFDGEVYYETIDSDNNISIQKGE